MKRRRRVWVHPEHVDVDHRVALVGEEAHAVEGVAGGVAEGATDQLQAVPVGRVEIAPDDVVGQLQVITSGCRRIGAGGLVLDIRRGLGVVRRSLLRLGRSGVGVGVIGHLRRRRFGGPEELVGLDVLVRVAAETCGRDQRRRKQHADQRASLVPDAHAVLSRIACCATTISRSPAAAGAKW